MASPTTNKTFRDKYGMTWNVFGPTSRGTWTAALQQPAYGTQPGDEVLSVSTASDFTQDPIPLLLAEANAYVDAYITSGGKPPSRGSTTVTATAKRGDGLGLALILVLLWAADRSR